MSSIGQAIRNAVEVEQAAARFYRRLIPSAADDQARRFLEEMAEQELEHAKAIEELGAKIAAGALPTRADANMDLVESAPGWTAVEGISLEQALGLALEAENSAALYYDAIADWLQGEPATFFRQLSVNEEQHAQALRDQLASLHK